MGLFLTRNVEWEWSAAKCLKSTSSVVTEIDQFEGDD